MNLFDLNAVPDDLRGTFCANPGTIDKDSAATILYKALADNEHCLAMDRSFEYEVATASILNQQLAGRTQADLDGPSGETDVDYRGKIDGVDGFNSVVGMSALWHAQRLIGAGVNEIGDNRGPLIDQMLQFCGVGVGNPYCAAGVSWCYHLATSSAPRKGGFPTSASSQEIREWFEGRGLRSNNPDDMMKWKGALFGWTSNKSGSRGHIGFVGDLVVVGGHVEAIITAEFNTSASGALVRDGKGSYIKKRTVQPHFWYLNTSDIPGGLSWTANKV